MAEIDPNTNDNPRVSPIKARQGDGSYMNIRVLIFSLGLIAAISLVGYAGWLWVLWSRSTS